MNLAPWQKLSSQRRRQSPSGSDEQREARDARLVGSSGPRRIEGGRATTAHDALVEPAPLGRRPAGCPGPPCVPTAPGSPGSG